MTMLPALIPTRNSISGRAAEYRQRSARHPLRSRLHEQPIAHRLNDVTTMFIDRGVDQNAPKLFQPSERALFIQADKAAIANHIGCKNRGKLSLNALFSH
jgi:hypothetical protein